MIFKWAVKKVIGSMCRPFISYVLKGRIPILAYHRVLDVGSESFPFDEQLISATPSQFEVQLSYLTHHFTPITFHDLSKHLKKAKPLPDNPIIITFDDGYFDKRKVCLPILRKYKVPAVFFVSTGYMGKTVPFWFDKVVYQLRHAKLREITLESLGLKALSLNRDREKVTREIISLLKMLPDHRRERALDEIENRTGIQVSPEHTCLSRPLTWEELFELHESGMEIGSHTVNHVILANCSDNKMYQELSESKRILECRLGIEVISVSYPVGGIGMYNNRVKRIAKKVGYHWGISYVHGISQYPPKDCYDLKRLRMEREVDNSILYFNLFRYAVSR